MAQSRIVEAPSISGQAHALVAGDGPPVVMVNGIGTPGAMWASLMAHLGGFRVHALDLPAYGLTDTAPALAKRLRSGAVRFLDEAVQALGLDRAAFVGNCELPLVTAPGRSGHPPPVVPRRPTLTVNRAPEEN